jgi:hypothetical protein
MPAASRSRLSTMWRTAAGVSALPSAQGVPRWSKILAGGDDQAGAKMAQGMDGAAFHAAVTAASPERLAERVRFHQLGAGGAQGEDTSVLGEFGVGVASAYLGPGPIFPEHTTSDRASQPGAPSDLRHGSGEAGSWVDGEDGRLARLPVLGTPRFVRPPFLSTRTYGAASSVTRGVGFPAPNPTRDGVSRSWLLRA